MFRALRRGLWAWTGCRYVSAMGDSHAAMAGHGAYVAGDGEGDIWDGIFADDVAAEVQRGGA